eukprot:1186918-Prorocentrum_minimum.AAC.2
MNSPASGVPARGSSGRGCGRAQRQARYSNPNPLGLKAQAHRVSGRLLMMASYIQMYMGMQLLDANDTLMYLFYAWIGCMALVIAASEWWLRVRDEQALR